MFAKQLPPSSYDELNEFAYFWNIDSARMYAADIIGDENKNKAAIVAAEVVKPSTATNMRTVQFSIKGTGDMDLAASELLGLYNKSYGTHFASLRDAQAHTPLRVNISSEAAIETKNGAAIYRAIPVSVEFYNYLDTSLNGG